MDTYASYNSYLTETTKTKKKHDQEKELLKRLQQQIISKTSRGNSEMNKSLSNYSTIGKNLENK